MTTKQNNNLQHISVSSITEGERYRIDYGDMDDLCASIREKGIFQPITVRISDNGYELLAGGRRLRAAQMLELDTIPALIRVDSASDPELELREIELFENMFRKDMEWPERVKLIARIHELWQGDEPWKWSANKTADSMGVSNAQISRQLNLADALEKIPALANCKDESEARRMMSSIEKAVRVNRDVAAHKEEMKKGGLDRVAIADSNFMIGDAFVGLDEIIALNNKAMGVSFIEVDPPYAVALNDTKLRTGVDNADLNEYNEVSASEYITFLNNLLPRLYSVAADDCWMVFWFGQTWYSEVKKAITDAGWKLDDAPGIWTKPYGQTMAPNYNLARSYEMFFICRKGSIEINTPAKGRLNVFDYKPLSPNEKYHPTQRPIELMDELYRCFGSPGKTAIIPFLGSGVSLRAAYRHKMRAMGWDLSERYKDQFLLTIKDDKIIQEL